MMIDNLTILLVGQLQTKPENLFILQLQYTEVNSVGISPHKKVWLTASCSLREKKNKKGNVQKIVYLSQNSIYWFPRIGCLYIGVHRPFYFRSVTFVYNIGN